VFEVGSGVDGASSLADPDLSDPGATVIFVEDERG
jgi:hypothetical protein